MKFYTFIPLLTVIFTADESTSARILGLVWHRAESHFPMFERLFKTLASRGHEVTVVSHFPQKIPVANYTDLSILGSMERFSVPLNTLPEINDFFFSYLMVEHNVMTCETVMKHENIQVLLKMEEQFDLIINEIFGCDCFLGFVHKFKAPHIGVMTSVAYPWSNDRIANPDHPAYIPNYFSSFTDRMNFWGRLRNSVLTMFVKLLYYYYAELPTHRIVKEYVGEDLPPLSDIARNTSLLLANSHFSLNQPRPTVPGFIEVAGLHIQEVGKLPQDIQKFMDEAKEGVIYFSLGSILRSETLPHNILQAFIQAFSELSLRVLWRCDPQKMPKLPDNILPYDWMPQREILAHPNVRVFITHGGMMGTQEAVYFGVPMVGIPFAADQKLNIQNYVSRDVAIQLNFGDITMESILSALKTVIYDPKYRDNAKELSQLFRDRPMSALDTAIYWIEYVIRHQGAPHLRSVAVDLPWYQYLLLDVALFVLISISITITILLLIIGKLCNCLSAFSREKSKKS